MPQRIESDHLRRPDCRAILEPEEYEQGLQELVFQAERAYAEQFGRRPELYAKGSTRVEFFGNFTDQGIGLHALGFPTNLGIVAAVGKREDRIIHIWSSIKPDEEPVEVDLDHLLDETLDVSHWSNYEKSILRQLREYFEKNGSGQYTQLQGANICLVANVPPGSAISTSAAVEASFTHGFLGINNVSIPERDLVYMTKKAENAIGSGCGILDQATSNAKVQPGHGVLLHFADQEDGIPYEAEQVYMDLERHGAQIALVLAKSFERNLARTDYGRKAQLIQEGSRRLAELAGKEADELTTDYVRRYYQGRIYQDDEMAKAVFHAISDDDRVLEAASWLNKLRETSPYSPASMQIINRLGEIMIKCAQSSIDNYGVSTGVKGLFFNQIIKAMRSAGAVGGRNEGGGGSPTSIALALKKDMPRFIKEFPKKMKELFSDLDFEVIPVSLGKPSRVLRLA